MKLRFTPPQFLFRTSLWAVLIGALIFTVACQEDSDQLPVRMHSEGELLSKAQDYFDQNSTFGKSESASARTINYGDYFPVWNKSKRVRKERDFLIVPFHRRINREYGDQNYIRRLVFEYDTEGELTRAGVIELISSTFSLRQLAERHETIIDQYLKGNPSEGVGIVWSDVNMNELVGTAGQGLGVTISTEGNNSSRIAEANCTYYFWVLSDKLTGEILSVTFLYKECPPIGFTDLNPCGGTGLRMTSDPYEGDSLGCPEDSGSGGITTLEDCEFLQLMGFDVECVLEEVEIVNELTDPCANAIFQQTSCSLDYSSISPSLLTGLNINSGIMSMFENATNFKYTIRQRNLGGPNASTTKTSSNTILVEMDNTYLATATKLSIARTMIHENLHAYFFHFSNASDFTQGLQNFVVQNNIVGLPNAHHELMGQYVLGMAVSLYLWDVTYGNNQNQMDFEYYKAMACAGLLHHDTNEPNDAFVAIAGDDLDEYLKIISDEASNSIDAKSNPC